MNEPPISTRLLLKTVLPLILQGKLFHLAGNTTHKHMVGSQKLHSWIPNV